MNKMNYSNKKIDAKIHEVGQTSGLNKKDTKRILNDIPSRNEQPALAVGPPSYMGSLYGTISTKDLQ